jgi:alanine or glycine:cation symporter, AGCS family
MEQLNSVLTKISDFLWGPPLMVALIGTGLFLTFRLGFVQFRYMFKALGMIFMPPHDKSSPGEISHFQALMTALAATVGTGNIAGVATAIAMGGPGAMFWMWVTGLVGMATKFSEAVLAIRYRDIGKDGKVSGGLCIIYRTDSGCDGLPLFSLFVQVLPLSVSGTWFSLILLPKLLTALSGCRIM